MFQLQVYYYFPRKVNTFIHLSSKKLRLELVRGEEGGGGGGRGWPFDMFILLSLFPIQYSDRYAFHAG